MNYSIWNYLPISASSGVKRYMQQYDSFLLWINFFNLYYWFFINLQITTEWAFSFLNNAVIIFCLIYSLNIPHSNQTHHFFLCKTQYPSLQNSDFGDISLHHYTIVTADVIKYYIVCLSFPGPQGKFSWAF